MMALPNFGIGVVYYLYLFGRSRAGTGLTNRLWCSAVLSFINIIIVKALPVSGGVPFDFFRSF